MVLIARVAAVAALPTLVVGCRAGYDVDVWNTTDQPITARLTTPHTDGAPFVITQKYIGIGDRGTLFTQREASERVALTVDFRGNPGYPATIDLSRGSTIVKVHRTDPDRVQLEVVPR